MSNFLFFNYFLNAPRVYKIINNKNVQVLKVGIAKAVWTPVGSLTSVVVGSSVTNDSWPPWKSSFGSPLLFFPNAPCLKFQKKLRHWPWCVYKKSITTSSKIIIVIFDTARAHPNDQGKAIESDCNAFVNKPITSEQLLAYVMPLIVTNNIIAVKISQMTGFKQVSTFTRSFQRYYGHNPTEHRNR